jgi:hypothetical protein
VTDRLPTPNEVIVNPDGTPTRVWWRYWQGLFAGLPDANDQPDAGLPGEVASLETRVAQLEGLISQLLSAKPDTEQVPTAPPLWGALEALSDRLSGVEARWFPTDIYVVVGSNVALGSLSLTSLVVSANAGSLQPAASGTVVTIGGADGVNPRLVIDAYAANGSLRFRRANTSAAAPSALLSGDIISNMGALGYDGTSYAANASTNIQTLATENWSAVAHGAKIIFNVTANGAVVAATALTIDQDSSVLFAGVAKVPGGANPLLTSTSAITSGAGVGLGTLTNAPAAGDPTKWVPINDSGTIRYFPVW